MTSSSGIAHTEETPRKSSGVLSGVQLWVALPDSARNGEASFAHHEDLPQVRVGDGDATVIVGAIGDAQSPAQTHSTMVGADIAMRGDVVIPLRREFEHALFVFEGTATTGGEVLVPDVLYYLAPGLDELS